MTPCDCEGFVVSGFSPTIAPNPRCCSDSRTLCANCARLALMNAGGIMNELVANSDDDYLPLPTMNFGRSRVADFDDPDSPLPLPVQKYLDSKRVGDDEDEEDEDDEDEEDEDLDDEEVAALAECRKRLGRNASRAAVVNCARMRLAVNSDMLRLPDSRWAKQRGSRATVDVADDPDMLPLPSMAY